MPIRSRRGSTILTRPLRDKRNDHQNHRQFAGRNGSFRGPGSIPMIPQKNKYPTSKKCRLISSWPQ
jgi:hypothetical protein